MSLIITAYNESKRIRPIIKRTQITTRESVSEIVVASDASTDGTDEIVAPFCAGSAVRAEERRGKEYAQFGDQQARDILVFSDVVIQHSGREPRLLPRIQIQVGAIEEIGSHRGMVVSRV
jgi:glycosyltransferase involved in cell wall biosynthesis